MKENVPSIKSSPDVLIFAEKTNNIYKATPEQYKKLLKDNVTKTYKNSSYFLEKSINMEAKHIAKKLKPSDRIEHLPTNSVFITLKDHKKNFSSELPCRLITPSKSELGKVGKKNWKKSTK